MNLPSSKYLILIETSNRADVGKGNLLLETITSLMNSGLWESEIDFHLLIHDSGSVDRTFMNFARILPRTTIVSCKERQNRLGNAYYSFKYARDNFLFDYLIHLEDDIIFCKNWMQNVDAWIKKHVNENDLIFSFFTPYNHTKILYDLGYDIWDEYKIGDFYGLQCIGIVREEMYNIIAALKAKIERGKVSGADIAMLDWFQSIGRSKDTFIKASCPCLVQHRNLHTLMTHGNQVLSYSFLGEEVDPGIYKDE